jgi:hypothetical protein
MFLSKDNFLKEIGACDLKLNKRDFLDQLIIQYKTPVSVKDFFQAGPKRANDKRFENPKECLEYFYKVLVTNRFEVLERFYNSYLFTPEIQTLFKKDLFDDSINTLRNTLINEEKKTIYIQRKDKTKRILRNLYAKEILKDTTITNSIVGKPNFWQSLYNFFQGKIDDRLFAPSSIQLYLRDKTTQTPIYLLQQYQSKASILNPAMLYLLLETKLNTKNRGAKIFTPEMSWSSYLLTFLSSSENWEEYIGVDVMDSVVEKSRWMYALFKKTNKISKKKAVFYQTPSESLLMDKNFLKNYQDNIDTIFYCPPYYDMEMYPDTSGNQSIDRYHNYESWLTNYFYKTLKLCEILLKKKGKLAIIIGNYQKKLNGEFYDLVGDFNKYISAQKSMELKEHYFLKNRTSPLKNNNKLRGEILFIFQKN